MLEHRYLTRVERPHGLPVGRRQRTVRVGRTAAYRDVEYRGLAAVVELDGRFGHELAADRWADLDRDITSLLVGDTTMRCSPGCAVADERLRLPGSGGCSAPGA